MRGRATGLRQPGRVRMTVDDGLDRAARRRALRRQRGVLAHGGAALLQHHGLENRVAGRRVAARRVTRGQIRQRQHGFTDELRQRPDESLPPGVGLGRDAARQRAPPLLDGQRQRVRGRCSGVACQSNVTRPRAAARQPITASDATQHFIQHPAHGRPPSAPRPGRKARGVVPKARPNMVVNALGLS